LTGRKIAAVSQSLIVYGRSFQRNFVVHIAITTFLESMNLIRFAEPVTVAFKKSAGGATITFEAGRDYVIANSQLDRIMRDDNVKNRSYKVSKLDSRLVNFNVGARKPGSASPRILLFNGSGGYGDQIITWPVAKILSGMGYEVHIMADPGNNVCWWNFPWVKTVNVTPLPYEQVKLYDYFVVYEAVVNMDEHPDQEHPVDTMLRKIGLDPKSVDPLIKVVRPNFTHAEMMATVPWREKQMGMYQLSAANPVRCLPPGDSVFMLLKLAEAYPDIHWLALSDEFNKPEYKTQLEEKIKELDIKNIQPYTSPNLRELWAITTQAKVVVAPDSMMVHIAGCMGVPCVGLWGPMSPGSRVAYYTNHVAIYHREFCPHSPCFAYSNVFPKYCPPREARTTCEVLAGISPTEVIDKVKTALNLVPSK
jgi:hypothetical protein